MSTCGTHYKQRNVDRPPLGRAARACSPTPPKPAFSRTHTSTSTPRALVHFVLVGFLLTTHEAACGLTLYPSTYTQRLQTYIGDGTDAFGYVGLDTVAERIVVAFKGTSDLRDWVSRVMFTPGSEREVIENSKIKAAEGFRLANVKAPSFAPWSVNSSLPPSIWPTDRWHS